MKDKLGGVSGTWVEEDDGFEAGILIVINLQLLEGQDQLIEDANGHTAHLCQLWAVPRDDIVIAWMGWRGEDGAVTLVDLFHPWL